MKAILIIITLFVAFSCKVQKPISGQTNDTFVDIFENAKSGESYVIDDPFDLFDAKLDSCGNFLPRPKMDTVSTGCIYRDDINWEAIKREGEARRHSNDTLEVDLNKVRHIKIRGRVYDLPTNQQCEEAEEDSVFTTQLTQE